MDVGYLLSSTRGLQYQYKIIADWITAALNVFGPNISTVSRCFLTKVLQSNILS